MGVGGAQRGLAPSFRNIKSKRVLNIHTIKVAIIVLDGVLGPLPLACHNIKYLFLCSSGNNAWGEVEGPWRAPCHLKKSFKGLRQRQGSCREEQERKRSPQCWVWFALSANQWWFINLAPQYLIAYALPSDTHFIILTPEQQKKFTLSDPSWCYQNKFLKILISCSLSFLKQ